MPGAWQAMGVMLSAAGSLQWLHDAVAPGVAFDALVDEAARWEPGVDGLLFLPYLAGERTPHADPDARGAFVGLELRHDRGALVRAVLEGVAFGLRDSLELLRDLGVGAAVGRVSGGGARSRLWLEIVASVLGVPLELTAVEEGSAFGAALLAGVAGGAFSDVHEAVSRCVRVGETVDPNPAGPASTRISIRATARCIPRSRRSTMRRCRRSETIVMEPVRWGILSTADINTKLLAGAAESPRCRGRRGRQPRPRPGEAFAQQHGIPRAYGSYDELLADPDVEAVYIPLPNTMHCEWSIRAVEAGKHVLCEKPMSRHAGDVERGLRRRRAARAASCPRRSCTATIRRRPGSSSSFATARSASFASSAPLQLRALRRREHPAAHGCRGRRADGRRAATASAAHGCSPASPRACSAAPTSAPTGTDWVFTGSLRFADGVLGLFDCGDDAARTATSSRRSARKARSSSTTRGTATSP